jgi:hypothetical protein
LPLWQSALTFHTELFGGTRKAALVGNGDEIAEVTQIHTYVFNIEVDISMYWTLWLIFAIFSPANELLQGPRICFVSYLVRNGFLLMSFFSKFLPTLALAVALSPLAAHAQTAPQQSQLNGQTVVQSGPANQMYPASTGG